MFQHLLVPIDGTELSEQAQIASLSLAAKLGARVTAFVAEPPAPLPQLGSNPSSYLQEAERHEQRTEAHAAGVLRRFEARAAEVGVAFAGVVERTDAVDEAIVRNAECSGCDLIVMATHGRGVFGELLHGSHTKSVLSRTKLPLLVLH